MDPNGLIPETLEHLKEYYIYALRKIQDLKHDYKLEEAELQCLRAEQDATDMRLLRETFSVRIRFCKKKLKMIEERHDSFREMLRWTKKKLQELS